MDLKWIRPPIEVLRWEVTEAREKERVFRSRGFFTGEVRWEPLKALFSPAKACGQSPGCIVGEGEMLFDSVGAHDTPRQHCPPGQAPTHDAFTFLIRDVNLQLATFLTSFFLGERAAEDVAALFLLEREDFRRMEMVRGG